MERSPLDFERVDVYRCAIDFTALTVRMTAQIPRGRADLRDQLRRAATSIPLNIAEASGKTGLADRARFHSIARGSALECAAILDVLLLMGAATSNDVEQGKTLLALVLVLEKPCSFSCSRPCTSLGPPCSCSKRRPRRSPRPRSNQAAGPPHALARTKPPVRPTPLLEPSRPVRPTPPLKATAPTAPSDPPHAR
jgi:four helix bundle protein